MTVYAATWIVKLASDWSNDEGASTESRCIISEKINTYADSLRGLLEKLEEEYFVSFDDVFIGGDDNEPVTTIGTNQFEDVDSNVLNNDEIDAGDLDVYLCDYTFGIEKRIVEDVSRDEFEAAGIKTH